MTFQEACEQIKNGKKVRRPNWPPESYLEETVKGFFHPGPIMPEDTLQDDWEILIGD